MKYQESPSHFRMTKLTGLNTAAFACLFIFVATILCVSCKKEDDVIKTPPTPPGPLIEQVDILVLNRITGLGIPEMTVELWDLEVFWLSDLIASKKTNGAGEVQFTQFSGDINGSAIILPEHTHDYQYRVWVNGELDSLFSILEPQVKLNSVAPQEITFELYPITRFNILASNVAPSAVTDTIKFTLANMLKIGGGFDSGIHEFELAGLQSNAMIEGEVKIENILTIDYEVITDTGTEQFSKTVVCEPGGMTEIHIDY